MAPRMPTRRWPLSSSRSMAWRAAAVSSVVTLERLGKSSPWAELVRSTAGAVMAAKSERKQSRLPPRCV